MNFISLHGSYHMVILYLYKNWASKTKCLSVLGVKLCTGLCVDQKRRTAEDKPIFLVGLEVFSSASVFHLFSASCCLNAGDWATSTFSAIWGRFSENPSARWLQLFLSETSLLPSLFVEAGKKVTSPAAWGNIRWRKGRVSWKRLLKTQTLLLRKVLDPSPESLKIG